MSGPGDMDVKPGAGEEFEEIREQVRMPCVLWFVL